MRADTFIRVGIDTGGTFTDVVAVADGVLRSWKLPSTPPDFERAVLEGVMAVTGGAEAELLHSSTVATNVLLERKGAKTGLVTTRGFRDVLEIGRQDRPELYALVPRREPPLIPRERRFEVTERVNAQGEVLTPLVEEELSSLVEKLRAADVRSVAVCLLFSFLRPEHEQRVGERLRAAGFTVSLSHEILPEFREYERTATTVVNAYTRPAMEAYLGRLRKGGAGCGLRRIAIVQSNGGTLTPERAGAMAVNTLLSGPAAGIAGLCRVAGGGGLISFDMGGTSTDVSLILEGPRLATGMRLAGLPVGVPMVDVHTVGAGGGSLASVDAGGALVVGPASAGADPGPACYGKGGGATVTDAHLVLGNLQSGDFLSGRMVLREELSRAALVELGRAMGGVTAEEAARGVLRLVNLHMENAIREISVRRGHDPRGFALAGFGGAGGLHVFALAEALEMERVLVPCHPGVLSALGAAASPFRMETARTLMWRWEPAATAEVEELLRELHSDIRDRFLADGLPVGDLEFSARLDMRYVGQSHEIGVDAGDLVAVAEAFHAEHRRLYGHAEPTAPVELVTLRVSAILPAAPLPLPELPPRRIGDPPAETMPGLWRRPLLRQGDSLRGPARIVEDYSTILVPAGWRVEVDPLGNLRGQREDP